MILFIPVIFLLTTAWFSYGFPRLIIFTEALAEWCQGLFLQCLEYLLIAKISFLWLGFIVVAGASLYAIVKETLILIRTHRQIQKLPLADYDNVRIIKDDKLKTAFTHGLFNPRIYISSGLIHALDQSEIEAVYLHELHHKNHKDPLRFFLLSIVRDIFLYIPMSRFFERLVHRKIEAKADDAVVAAMEEPISLAGALLKIAGFNKEASSNAIPQPVSISGIGSPEARIRRLLERTEEKIKLPATRTIIASIFITVFLAASLAMPLFASFPDPGRCDTSHCAVHTNKLGKDCQSHCEVSEHRH